MVFLGTTSNTSSSTELRKEAFLLQIHSFKTKIQLLIGNARIPYYAIYQTQEGYIEEVSTYFYLDTALLKSSESVLSET